VAMAQGDAGAFVGSGRGRPAHDAVAAQYRLGLIDDGVAFFTAAKTAQVRRGQVDGVVVDATVGIGKPTWAADSSGGWTPWEPGTVNIVVQMAEPLSPAAAVNGVITVTEAKSQAFVEAGIGGTGTASDAVALVWPTASTADPHDFAGPRSDIGSRIALATHQAVTAGIDDWLRNNRG